MRKLALAGASVLLTAGLGFAIAEAKTHKGDWKAPAYVFTALGDKDRPADDVKLDAARKPAELITFAHVRPGETVVELLPGGGYFTHIIADVVGPKGHVYAMVGSQKGADRIKAIADHHANVTVQISPPAAPVLPGNADVVWTTQNYHDLHNVTGADLAKINTAVFGALKPGGFYFVVDHAAKSGSGLADTNTLHRIDEAVVKKEVEAAGFRLDGESRVLRNPADDHTIGVTDDKIRHHTDQFILRFRKPRH